MNQKLDLLIKQLGIEKQKLSGTSTEKVDLDGQFHIIFNYAEVVFNDKLYTNLPLKRQRILAVSLARIFSINIAYCRY